MKRAFIKENFWVIQTLLTSSKINIVKIAGAAYFLFTFLLNYRCWKSATGGTL